MSWPRDSEPHDLDAEQQILQARFDVAAANLADAQADYDHSKAVRSMAEMLNVIRGTRRLLQEL